MRGSEGFHCIGIGVALNLYNMSTMGSHVVLKIDKRGGGGGGGGIRS